MTSAGRAERDASRATTAAILALAISAGWALASSATEHAATPDAAPMPGPGTEPLDGPLDADFRPPGGDDAGPAACRRKCERANEAGRALATRIRERDALRDEIARFVRIRVPEAALGDRQARLSAIEADVGRLRRESLALDTECERCSSAAQRAAGAVDRLEGPASTPAPVLAAPQAIGDPGKPLLTLLEQEIPELESELARRSGPVPAAERRASACPPEHRIEGSISLGGMSPDGRGGWFLHGRKVDGTPVRIYSGQAGATCRDGRGLYTHLRDERSGEKFKVYYGRGDR